MTTTRVLGGLGRALIALGIIVLLFAVFQLWGTGVREARAQSSLRTEFDQLLAEQAANPTADPFDENGYLDPTVSTGATGPADPTADPAADAATEPVDLSALEAGDPVARIQIDKLGVDKIVVEGVQVSQLREGPGHYRATPRPGEGGNAAIAGHRTTYGQPFHDIDLLEPGDTITVTTLAGELTYQVVTPQEAYGDLAQQAISTNAGNVIVDPNAGWVLDDFGDDRLTLTACHPKFSARQRIIVTAVLVDGPGADRDDAAGAAIGSNGDTTAGVTREILDTDAAVGVAAGDDGSAPRINEAFIDEVTLDEGLDGERSALLPAVLFGLLAFIVFQAGKYGGRTWKRLPAYAMAALPYVGALWLCFQQVDTLLPAY